MIRGGHSQAHMKPERIQLGLAIIGIPLLLVFWKQDAKWPNPFRAPPKEKGVDP